MNNFGKYSGYDSELYYLKIPPGMIPEALIIPKLGGRDRDFVIVPERQLVESISSLGNLGFSKILDERFAYIDPNGMVIDLQGAALDIMNDAARDIRFAVVRWNRKCQGNFPREITCVAHAGGLETMPSNCPREIITTAPNKK